MDTTRPNPRRNFLLAASLGGAGVVAMAAAAHLGSRVAIESDNVAAEKSGYRASPHILTYYKTARF